MNSKKKPLWLTFENADPSGSPIVVMLKCGDDLRMDMVTLQLFQAMQIIWFENGLQVKMSLYKVLCTGYMQVMLENGNKFRYTCKYSCSRRGCYKAII